MEIISPFRTLSLFQRPDSDVTMARMSRWTDIPKEFTRRDGSPVTLGELMLYGSIRLRFKDALGGDMKIADVTRARPNALDLT
jgi:hypothetical protein